MVNQQTKIIDIINSLTNDAFKHDSFQITNTQDNHILHEINSKYPELDKISIPRISFQDNSSSNPYGIFLFKDKPLYLDDFYVKKMTYYIKLIKSYIDLYEKLSDKSVCLELSNKITYDNNNDSYSICLLFRHIPIKSIETSINAPLSFADYFYNIMRANPNAFLPADSLFGTNDSKLQGILPEHCLEIYNSRDSYVIPSNIFTLNDNGFYNESLLFNAINSYFKLINEDGKIYDPSFIEDDELLKSLINLVAISRI